MRVGFLFAGGVLLGAGGYCFGTQTQSAKVQIPRPYRPLRKSPQKSPGGTKMAGLANKTREHPSIMTQGRLKNHPKNPLGWLKWQVLRMKPERVGLLFAGGVLLESGGVLFWATDAKCKSANCQAAPLENHPKNPLGGLKWRVLQINPESTPQS